MATTLMALKIQKYITKREGPDLPNDPVDESITEKTQTQLQEYKASRKLPLLGVNFHRVKDRPILKKDKQHRNNLSAIDVLPSTETPLNETVSSYLSPPQAVGANPLEKDKTFVQLEQMLNVWEVIQGQAHNKFLATSPIVNKVYTDRVSPDLTGRTREDILDSEASFVLDRSPKSFVKSTTKDEVLPNQLIKKIPKQPGFEYNNPYKVNVQGSGRGKPRSRSIPCNNTRSLSTNQQQNPTEAKSRLVTENDSRRKNTLSSSDDSQSPALGPKPARSGQKNVTNMSISTCASPNISTLRPVIGGENSGLNSDKKEVRGHSVDSAAIPVEKDEAFGGRAFYHTDILKSKLPLNVIEHPTIPKVKALHPNHVLMGRPLQLPLTNVMENVLKKVESTTKKKNELDQYGKTLLRGTYRDYFNELNPLGRLESQEIELLNGLNENYRARRGLRVSTKHNFTSEFLSMNDEAEKRSQKLLQKLMSVKNTEESFDGVIKEHRRQMPMEINRKFLESSFDTNLNKNEIKESIAEKIKKYDAWYVAPVERHKRFSGIFAHSNVARNRFKHRPSEYINPESIKTISKEAE